MRGRKQTSKWIFCILAALNIVVTCAESLTKTFANPALDGLQFTTTFASTSSEGFKPSSFDFVRSLSSDHYKDASEFAEKYASVHGNDTSDPHSIRIPITKNGFKLDVLTTDPPTVITLFNSTEKPNDSENSSSTKSSTTELLPTKSSRLYYDDIPSRNRGQGLGYPSASLNEISVSGPHHPNYHHSKAGYKFYVPDKYNSASKYSRDAVVPGNDHVPNAQTHEHVEHAHTHSHSHTPAHIHAPTHVGIHDHYHHHGHDHGHGADHHHHISGYSHGHDYTRGVISGSGHDLGYSAGPVHAPYNYPPPHYGSKGHSSADIQGFIGGPALGKALSVLLPSALLLTGVSALFPKRVLVPTQNINNNQRQKRSVSEHLADFPEFDDDNFEVVPSQLLRREHRSQNGEDKLYDYQDILNNPYGVGFPPVPSPSQAPMLANFAHQNHRVNHVPPLIINSVPEFLPIPDDHYHPPIYALGNPPHPDIQTTQEPVQQQQEQEQEQEQSKEQQDEQNVQQYSQQQPRTIYNIIDGHNEYGSYQIETNPTEVGTVPAERAEPFLYFLKPTASTKPLNEPTPSTNFLSTTGDKTDGRQSKSISSAQRSQNLADKVENIKASSSIGAQTVAHPNSKDVVTGKGAAKVLKELMLATEQTPPKEYDLSPNGPVIGLLTAAVEHGGQSDPCQRRALCELALRGTNPTATRFETFLWSLATLVPDAFTTLYDVDDVFAAIRGNNCAIFKCANPDLNIQQN